MAHRNLRLVREERRDHKRSAIVPSRDFGVYVPDHDAAVLARELRGITENPPAFLHGRADVLELPEPRVRDREVLVPLVRTAFVGHFVSLCPAFPPGAGLSLRILPARTSTRSVTLFFICFQTKRRKSV